MSGTIWRKLGLLGASSMLVLGGGCIGGGDWWNRVLLFAYDATLFNVVN